MQKGFTLIELAIVIVVVGLIIVGVVGGRSIMDSSKRHAQIKFFQEIDLAVQAYNLEYDAYPGDHDEAESYFSSYPGIINGNGNKRLDNNGLPWARMSDSSSEIRRFWMHLAASDIIRDLKPDDDGIITKGVDIPLNPIGNGTATIAVHSPNINNPGYVSPPLSAIGMGHFLWLNIFSDNFAHNDSNRITTVSKAVWRPIDAKNIDAKIDDGNPLRGRFFAPYYFASGWANSEEGTGGQWNFNGACRNLNTSKYINLDTDYRTCYLVYKLIR